MEAMAGKDFVRRSFFRGRRNLQRLHLHLPSPDLSLLTFSFVRDIALFPETSFQKPTKARVIRVTLHQLWRTCYKLYNTQRDSDVVPRRVWSIFPAADMNEASMTRREAQTLAGWWIFSIWAKPNINSNLFELDPASLTHIGSWIRLDNEPFNWASTELSSVIEALDETNLYFDPGEPSKSGISPQKNQSGCGGGSPQFQIDGGLKASRPSEFDEGGRLPNFPQSGDITVVARVLMVVLQAGLNGSVCVNGPIWAMSLIVRSLLGICSSEIESGKSCNYIIMDNGPKADLLPCPITGRVPFRHVTCRWSPIKSLS